MSQKTSSCFSNSVLTPLLVPRTNVKRGFGHMGLGHCPLFVPLLYCSGGRFFTRKYGTKALFSQFVFERGRASLSKRQSQEVALHVSVFFF
jgi:hypothetical protein